MAKRITLSAPSRLHFGLFSVGEVVTHRFGGVGLMIDSPRTTLTATPSNRFSISGPGSDACRNAIENWFQHAPIGLQQLDAIENVADLPVAIEIESLPSRHSGFGTGTQLALSSALAVMMIFDLHPCGPESLAAMTGRGKRSGIGSYGFFQGGFLVDRGKTSKDSLAPLDFQSAFPRQWPIVTVIHRESIGISGNQESEAFKEIKPTSESERNEMIEIVRRQMIPGVLQGDYEMFAEGVFEFGRRSGMMFSSIQQGIFNGPHVSSLVDEIREFGVRAVGQSSWGPCVFAVTRTDQDAHNLVAFLKDRHQDDCLIELTRADNEGVRIVDG